MVIPQTLARDGCQMYRKVPDSQLSFEDFYLPFGGTLSGNNRWVRLARIIPWDLAESFYAEQFSQNPQGPSAKSARLALGALIIKERLGVSDEEAVEQIRENPYLRVPRTLVNGPVELC